MVGSTIGHAKRWALAVLLALLLVLDGASLGRAGDASMTHHVRPVTRAGMEEWRVVTRVEGLDRTRPNIVLELPPWGGWTELGKEYLLEIRGTPPLVAVPGEPGRFRPRLTSAWDGVLTVRYALRVSRAGGPVHGGHPLLPFSGREHAVGFSNNVLLQVVRDGERLSLRRGLLFRARPGWIVATGWGGRAPTGARLALDDDPSSGVLSCGRPTGTAVHRTGEDGIEVVQFGRGPELAREVRDRLVRLRRVYRSRTGWNPRVGPVRVVVTDARTYGAQTQEGILLSIPDRGPGPVLTLDRSRHLAHELFHEWLGTGLRAADGSLDWVKEGVAEYVAHWALVHTGVAPLEWFAGSLSAMAEEVASNPLASRVAFADPTVDWRGGPAVESLIYRKACLAAFHLDVELKARGSGLMQILGELRSRHGEVYDLAALLETLERRGLGGSVDRFLRGSQTPDLYADLGRAGYFVRRVPTRLTDLGIELERGAPLFGKVAAIEPGGPADRAGVAVGDVMVGLGPTRGRLAGPVGPRRYGYGLRILEPKTAVFLDVTRAGKRVRVEVRPRLEDGGTVWTVRPRGALCARFFESGCALPARLP